MFSVLTCLDAQTALRGFHRGDATHGLPLDVHLLDASSLLPGSYPSLPDISQFSPSRLRIRYPFWESYLTHWPSSPSPHLPPYS